MQRTGGNRVNGEPLFSPLAPVQLSLSRGRDALSGALAQRAGPGANPRGKTRIGTSVVQGRQKGNTRNPYETAATGRSGIHEPGQTIVGKRIPLICLDGFSGSHS